MAPRHRLSLFVVAAAVLLVSGGSAADDGATTTTMAARDGYLGDKYIGCLEMLLSSRCFADPTVPCVEDAIVECTLQVAAAAPAAAAAATGPAAPLPGGGAELLLGAIRGRGGVVRGVFNLGANYIQCAAVNLAGKCLANATMGCVEEALACN